MLARRTLFLTLNLFEKLTENELKAVVYHEAAHLKQNHLWKRLFSAMVYLCLGIFWAVLPFCLWMPGDIGAATGAIFLAIFIQLFFLGRKIYQQEIEADLVAVEMGASSDALISALEKLSPGSEKEISPLTRLVFGVYHPTAFTRIQAIRSGGVTRDNEIFPKKQYFAAYSLFVVGFLFYSAQNLEANPTRSPAHSAKVSHSETSATRR